MSLDAVVLTLFVLGMTILLHWLPLWRRHQLWFGVTVPPGFAETPEGRRALSRYRASIWLLSIAAAAAVLAGGVFWSPWLTLAGLLGQAVGASATFAVVRRSIRPFSVDLSRVRSAEITPDAEGLPGGLASVIGPLGVLAASAVYLWTKWEEIPARLPVHWALNGLPDRWADRRWLHVYGQLLTGAMVVVLQLGMAEAILRRSPRGRVPGTERWTGRFRRANLLLLIVGTWGVAAISAVLALAPLWSPNAPSRVVGALPWVLLAVMVPFVWQIVRLTRDARSAADGTPDSAWKLGLFYYNPDDAAVMVEKRFGVGYTVNFGNRLVWWLLGFAALVVVLVRVLAGAS